MTKPSFAFVNDTCLSACKAMKLQSKQLMCLSSSFQKRPFEKSGESILEALMKITKSINDIQDSLIETGNEMNIELETNKELINDEPILVTNKEYRLLNNVFQEYTEIIDTSNEFSIFSNSHDIHRELGLEICQNKEEISKTN